MSDDPMKALLGYDWPGNVRELENCLERCCAMTSGNVIHMVDLPSSISGAPAHVIARGTETRIMPKADLEKQTILGTIAQLNGDKLMAAKLLGMSRPTFHGLITKYEVNARDFR